MSTRKKKLFKGRAFLQNRVWHYANVPMLLATLVIVAITLIAEDASEDAYIAKTKAEVHNQATQAAMALRGAIIANLESARGMAHDVSLHPDMTGEHFDQHAEKIFHKFSFLTSITFAPDLVISELYPNGLFEHVIGFDYNTVDRQRILIEKARREEQVVITSPIEMTNGKQGVLIHYPIFVDDPDKGRYFLGVITAVLTMDRFYEFAGLTGPNLDIDYALFNKGEEGFSTEPFWGSAEIDQRDPVIAPIGFKVANWELHAVPKGGWVVPPYVNWGIRAIAFVAFLLIVVPMAIVARLSRERMAHLNAHIESQRELNIVSKRLEYAVESLKLGVWEYDPEIEKYSWDMSTRELFGVDADYDVNSHEWKQLIAEEDRERLFVDGPRIIAEEGNYLTDYRLIMPDGQVKTVRVSTFSCVDDEGKMRYVGVNWDISKNVEREEALKEARAESEQRYVELNKVKTRIEFIAMHDYLTELPNRQAVDEVLRGEGEIAWPFEYGSDSWLLKINLDGFKEINDSFGHAAGDAMLLRVADLLRSQKQEGEYIARIGGDEFVVLCSSVRNKNRPLELAEGLINLLQKPQNYKGLTCRLGASIGISNWTDAKGNIDKLRSNADLALYQSKQSGKGCFTFFSQPLFQNASEKRRMADDLLRGIENQEFIAFYQGQYSAQDHRLAGAEALARWMHPKRGLVFPDMFIEMADTLGVTADIDRMVLEHAIETKKIWAENDLHLERISVNVSAKRLNDRDLIPSLKSLDFDPQQFTFELVESTFLDRSAPQVAANIRILREMGVEIEIDDFGTAYASIVSLTHLLPNRLKIDRELVFPVASCEHQRELVHSIIHIGRTLGIGVVAEGIESMEHAEILRIMGVDLLQGYAFSKPMSREDFISHHKKDIRVNVA